MNLYFILTLPVKADEHNATHVSADGKTLKWKIRPDEENPIYMSMTIPNFITWGIFIIGSILFLIVFLARRSKRKKNQPPRIGTFGGPPTAAVAINWPRRPKTLAKPRFWDVAITITLLTLFNKLLNV